MDKEEMLPELEILRNENKKLLDIINRIAGVLTDIDTELLSDEDMGLKPVEGLDIAKGIKHFDNNKEWYIKILYSYLEGTKTKLGIMENPSKESLAQYEVAVHGIKGSSYGVYAEDIGAMAAELEKAAAKGNLSFVAENNSAFLKKAWKLIHGIEDMLAVYETGVKRQVRDKPDENALRKLLAACESYDMQEAEAAADEIFSFQYESDQGLADWLKKNIDEMNYESIVEKLKNMRL